MKRGAHLDNLMYVLSGTQRVGNMNTESHNKSIF